VSVLTEFRRVAGEFTSTSDDDINDLAETVSAGLDATTFGTRLYEAIARLVAHEMTLTARAQAGSDAVGPTTSIKTGDLAASWAAPAMSADIDDAYRSTRHGVAFLAIRNSRATLGAGILC
jgi:hypothetical protein